MEDPEVWEVTHAKVVELAQAGLIDGVRIDHPDGLANPRRYLERLREAGIERAWVEKILEPGERLRPEWPVEGTTGYEFLNDVTALFVDPAGEEPLTRLYEELTGERRPFADVAADAKLEQARTTFDEEAAQLAAKLPFEADVAAALASFHVYRTYVEPDAGLVTEDDRCGDRGRAPARGAGKDPPARGARARCVRRPVPADDAARARQGRRGHSLLPLEPLRGAERGGRRSRPLLALGRRIPRGESRASARRPPRDDDPRHEAERRRPRAPRLHRLRSRRLGARGATSGSQAGAIRTRRT